MKWLCRVCRRFNPQRTGSVDVTSPLKPTPGLNGAPIPKWIGENNCILEEKQNAYDERYIWD